MKNGANLNKDVETHIGNKQTPFRWLHGWWLWRACATSLLTIYNKWNVAGKKRKTPSKRPKRRLCQLGSPQATSRGIAIYYYTYRPIYIYIWGILLLLHSRAI
jgi:hypothetical protein